MAVMGLSCHAKLILTTGVINDVERSWFTYWNNNENRVDFYHRAEMK